MALADTAAPPAGVDFGALAASWQVQLLQQIGAPVTAQNVQALTLWANSEGVQQSNNPLAISGYHAGATRCLSQCGTSSPVYAYADQASGVNATAQFLNGSYYTGIVYALRSNAGLAGLWRAINQSPWCSGCQGGQYPNALYAGAGGANPTASTPGASAVAQVSGQPIPQGVPGGPAADRCLFNWPGQALPIVGTVGGGCAFTTANLRALAGVAALAAGGIVALAGVALLASGSRATTLAAAVAKVPGVGWVKAASASSAPSAAERASTARYRRQSDLADRTTDGRLRGAAAADRAGPFPEE